MKLEIQAIERNQTWELVTLPHQTKKIGVKQVFKTKLNEEGKVDKSKARLVAKGYSQKAGVDTMKFMHQQLDGIQSEFWWQQQLNMDGAYINLTSKVLFYTVN